MSASPAKPVSPDPLAEQLARVQAELRIANERLRSQAIEKSKLALIAARTNNGVVLSDAQGRVEWINEGFNRLTGYTIEEMRGKKPGSVLQGPETDPATVRYIHDRISNGLEFKVEILNYKKNKKKYWVSVEVQPIRDEAGKITNFMAIQSDITDRVNAERELRSTNALQRAIFQGAGYAIIYTDPQGVIQLFNPAAERMLGYMAAELVGQQTPALIHEPAEVQARARELTAELGHEVKPGFETFVAKAELGLPDEREWTYVCKNGARLSVMLSVTALFDDLGKITGYLGIASDLTTRKRDEERLRNMVNELERFNQVMLHREERVLELKQEINQMLAAAGLPPAYPSVLDNGKADI